MNLITRRTALKFGSLAAASVALGSTFGRAVMAKSLASSPGLQLYSVGKELTADTAGTLAKIAAIGYRQVESAGLAGKTSAELRKALDQAGLKCPSSHMFPAPGQAPEQYLQDIKTLGSDYVVSSFMIDPAVQLKSMEDYIKYAAGQTPDDFRKMADRVNKLASLAKSVGLKFCYHNHNMEFRRWEDGTTAYDTFMAATDPALVNIELDCGWADLGGASPLALFKQYRGRVRMLHIKDFVAVPKPIVAMNENSTVQWTELGHGHMDYKQILAAAPSAGVEHIFVEQEPPYVKFGVLEYIKLNFDYLRSIS